jgi:hypothetical protein
LATVTPVATTTTVVFTFSVPVVVSGIIPLGITNGATLVSQVVNSSTEVTQVYSATVATATWSIPANAPVATYQGGGLAPASGTF